ncbi:hypothetical protein D3C71_1325810 [compost metagenome]
MGTLGLSRCPIRSAIQRQTAHAAKSSPLQEQLQGLLLAGSASSAQRRIAAVEGGHPAAVSGVAACGSFRSPSVQISRGRR